MKYVAPLAALALGLVAGACAEGLARPSYTLLLHDRATIARAEMVPWRGSSVAVDGSHVLVEDFGIGYGGVSSRAAR